MIPIRDDAPHYTTPWVNYFLIALNTLVFLFELALGPRHLDAFLFSFGMVPAHLTAALRAGAYAAALLPVLTSMFLHAGWLHIIFNMWWLWIFGDNVEDSLGHFRYLIFYLLSGLGAALVHIMFNLGSQVPSVGASGAIAGVMGAYFVLFPSARVLTFIFVFFTWLPAWLILGYWFVLQFLSGAATSLTAQQGSSGGIAVWAHVGGFLTGVVMIKLFPRRAPRYHSTAWQ
ncbi:MAG TPA: rhomboid family intramembrane serine protease [Terriglobia bacterium]|nr:rhomboid family intramembrane serine protease [Terriglobia bacterium]